MATWNQRNRERYNASWRRWYRKNAKRKVAWQMRRRAEIRRWFRELKAMLKCMTCEESTPECLQFHHRDPSSKIIDVSSAALNRCWARERILAEIAKCDVLCANCHLKLHWEERQRKKSG